MSDKTITLLLFTLVLLVFAAYFFILHLIFPAGQPVISRLDNMALYAEEGRWAEARKAMDEIEGSWNRVKGLIALNYAEPDYISCQESFGRLRGALKIEDVSEVVREAAVCRRLMNNLVKIVPQP